MLFVYSPQLSWLSVRACCDTPPLSSTMSVLPYVRLSADILRDEQGLAALDRGWLQLRAASSYALRPSNGTVLDGRFDYQTEAIIFVFLLGQPRAAVEAYFLMSVALRQSRHLPLDLQALARFTCHRTVYERLSGRSAFGRGRVPQLRRAELLAAACWAA